MTPEKTGPRSELPSRRDVLSGALCAVMATTVLPRRAQALTADQARALINRVVAEINGIIASRRSESDLFARFEAVFRRYADVPAIAGSVLGPDGRRATSRQRAEFADAFAGYISRKYGRRFREVVGGRVDVTGVRAVNRYWEVVSTARLPGQAPFEVLFRVSDRGGRPLFFDMVIEGISLGKTERVEIGALLDRNRGDFDAMIAALRRAG